MANNILPLSGFIVLFCPIYVVCFLYGIINLHWCWCSYWEEIHLSLKQPLSDPGSVPQARIPSTSQLVLCPLLLTVALPSLSPVQLSSRMERLLGATLWWLSFETPWECFVRPIRERFSSRSPVSCEKKILFGAKNSLENILPFLNRVS